MLREEGEGEDGVVGIWPRKGLEVWHEDVQGKRNRQRTTMVGWRGGSERFRIGGDREEGS